MYLQSFCFTVLGSINTMIMMIKITNMIPPTTNLILDFEDDNFDEPLNGTFSSSTCIRVLIISLKATLVFFSFSSKKKENEMIINIMIDKGFQNICYCHRMSKIFNPIPQLWSGQSLKWDIHFDKFCLIFVQTLDTPEVFYLQY